MQGIVKVNWDASVDKERNVMGMGIVARDYEGKFLAGLCASQRYLLDPATAEAMAAWKMVEFCINMEFGNVWLEGDCLEVVKALNSAESVWGRYGSLINDAKMLLDQFQQWKVVHVPRTCNRVAHKLAKSALTCSDEVLWQGDIPLCIHGDITAEAGLPF
jgi:ribonuclease HI